MTADKIGERIAALEAMLESHIAEDNRRFERIDNKLAVIADDIKVLLQRTVLARTLTPRRMPWKTIGTILGAAATFGAWLKGWLTTT